MARRSFGLIALAAAMVLAVPPRIDLAPEGRIVGARAATIRLPHRWPASTLWADVVYWWPLATESAGVTPDATGNGRNGTLDGGATISGGSVSAGGAYPADRVLAPLSASCASATAATITADVYLPASMGGTALWVYNCDNGVGGYVRLGLLVNADRTVTLRVREHGTTAALTASLTSTATVSAETWTRIWATYDAVADQLIVCVGATCASAAPTLAGMPGTSGVNPPAWGGFNDATNSQTGPTDARLREVGIWRRALSAEERAAVAAGARP